LNTEQPTLTVVIPVYNEAENILRTLGDLEQHAPQHTEVMVVYDFPEDTTIPALAGYGGSKLTLLPTLNSYGSGAVNAIRYGLENSKGDAVLVVMGDMSDDLSILPKMLDYVREGADIVCGSRYMPGGKHIGGPVFKKTLSRSAGVSLRLLLNFPTHDVTNSFKMYTRRVLDAIELESSGGFEIGMEIVVKSWVMGFEIAEIPSVWRDRTAGSSRFKLWAWLPYYLRWYFIAIAHKLGWSRKGR
jgi:dolichol-phosphate mannosyltransferase